MDMIESLKTLDQNYVLSLRLIPFRGSISQYLIIPFFSLSHTKVFKFLAKNHLGTQKHRHHYVVITCDSELLERPVSLSPSQH